MKMVLRRVILWTNDIEQMADFYEKKVGLKMVDKSEGFVDFEAGRCHLALHKGTPKSGTTKICFYAADVTATRAELIERGIKMGKDPGPGEGLKLCDFTDPEGNKLQLSNRE